MNIYTSTQNILIKIRLIYLYFLFKKKYKRLIKIQDYNNQFLPGETEFLDKWHQLTKFVEPYSYRFFSRYCGLNPDIIPEYIGDGIIQEKLSPRRYRPFYQDKNLYAQYIGKNFIPKTFLCRINKSPILLNDYTVLKESFKDFINNIPQDTLILKPSIDSNSGKGVQIFKKIVKEGHINWLTPDNNKLLTEEYLYEYGENWILQEAIIQHPYIAQFSSSSVNTFRICAYRSSKDNQIKIPAAALRIGKEGCIIDNACAGGKFVGIDINTGKLGNYVCDKDGNKSSVWNSINFEEQEFYIPNWAQILNFAKEVASKNLHCRALGLDIALKDDGNPVLIEYNVEFYGYWLFMYTGQNVFGEYLNEIIDYCKR